MIRALFTFNLFALLFTLSLIFVLNRYKFERGIERSILLILVQQSVLALAAVFFPLNGFGRIQLLVWGVFLFFPILLLGNIVLFRRSSKSYSSFLVVILVLMLTIAVDAFVVEPRSLEVSRIRLYSEKIPEPVRIAFLADIQTDSPGSYEEYLLDLVIQEKPDVVLMAGDYLQIIDPDQYHRGVIELNRIFKRSGLSPVLGMAAVRGNVDWNGWDRIFQDLDVMVMEKTGTVDLGPLSVTGIGLLDSENAALKIPGNDNYHLVLGHSPNFSLGEIEADLLLAGHTHGGQVRLPGIGPLLTLAAVPRLWAAGLTEIHPGQFLLVSRGIGLERGNAPRMRFMCHPELIIIDLLPPGNILN